MRLNAIFESSGENETNPARGTGNSCGNSESRPTAKSEPTKSSNDRMRERKTTRGLVFSHAITMLLGPMRSETSRNKSEVSKVPLNASDATAISFPNWMQCRGELDSE